MVIIETEGQNEFQTTLTELGGDGIVFVTDMQFNINPPFPSENWNAKFVVFKNCRFLSHLYFTNISLNEGIEFDDCIFERGVSFENCTSGEHPVYLSDGSPFSVSLSHCQLKYRFIINSCNFKYSILIHRASSLGNLELSNTKLKDVRIEDSTINSSFEAINMSLSHRFYFNASELKGEFTLDRCTGDVELISSKCYSHLKMQDSEMHLIIIQDAYFKEDLKIVDCRVTTLLQLNDSTFDKAFLISNLTNYQEKSSWIKSLDLQNCDFKGGFEYEGRQTQHTTQLGDLQIGCNDRLKGNLNFTNLRIGKIIIGGINVASIVLAYTHLSELHLLGFINKGALTLVSLCPLKNAESMIYISKSLLAKTFISDCDLSSFDSITITHSNLTELTTTSVIWFRENQLNVKNPIDLLFSSPPTLLNGDRAIMAIAYMVKRDLYRQLKFAMEKQGDQLNRLRFKKEELTAYRKEIIQYRYQKKYIGDRIILWVNKSNDYGFNWLKPIGIILFITSIFYCILAISINSNLLWQPSVDNMPSTLEYLKDNFYNYFNLLNPTHKVTDLFDIRLSKQPSFWFYLYDFLDRLIASYLIFQTITAFRKYIS